jgi:glucosylceramidase
MQKRISSVSSRSSLITTSFLNQDGKVVTVVMNKTDRELQYNLCIGTKATAVVIPPHAIQTLFLKSKR